MAIEIVEQLEGVVGYDWVGGDTVYGNSPGLREALREKGKAYVLDVGENLKVCLEEPQPVVPQGSGLGRRPSKWVIAEKPVALKQVIGQIEAEQWRTIQYREGTKGKMVREAVLKKVRVWKKGTAQVARSGTIDQSETRWHGSEIQFV